MCLSHFAQIERYFPSYIGTVHIALFKHIFKNSNKLGHKIHSFKKCPLKSTPFKNFNKEAFNANPTSFPITQYGLFMHGELDPGRKRTKMNPGYFPDPSVSKGQLKSLLLNE